MLYISVVNWIFFICTQLTCAEEKENESDITSITIRDLPGDYSDNPGQELVLDGKSNEKAMVFPKKSLFSNKFKVSDCSKSGCTTEKLSDEQKTKLDKCNFEGYMVNDPDSKVTFVKCNENGAKDISIVSEKVNLTHDVYRIDSEGKIDVAKLVNFTDELKHDIENDDDDGYTDIGMDYSDDSDMPEFNMFFGKNMHAVTVLDVDSECCRPLRTQCEVLDDGKVKKCKVQKGKIVCKEGEGINNCAGLKEYARKKAEEQNKEVKTKKNEEASKEIKSKEEKNAGEEKEAMKEITSEEEENSGEDSDYDSAYDESTEKVDKNAYSKSKHNKDLSKSELVKLVKEINAPKTKGKTNPKCAKKKSSFRSLVFISAGCLGEHCRKKDPVPKAKVYPERTVEFGVYIDKQLYKKMSEEIKSSDNERIKQAMVEMVHSILVEVETFLTHKTFTTLKGGFKIAINGIHIYKEDDEDTQKWDSERSLSRLLYSFQAFANQVNGACDAEEDSFDAMILLTGRGDELADVGPDQSVGYAFVGEVCKISPVLVLTLRLDGKGSHDMSASRLLSHELGHLFGADHDGMRPKNQNSIYYEEGSVPCPAMQNLMSPSVGQSMNSWSECTTKMIDSEYERREEKETNCFFT